MTDIQKLRQQLNYAKKQTAFAWAQYYQQLEENHNNSLDRYDQNNRIIESGSEVLPDHLVNEIYQMNEKLKKEINCPICLNTIDNKEYKLKITGCGHKYCEDCFNKIDTCAVCRKKIYKKNK